MTGFCDGMVSVTLLTGCYCNVFYCEHRFRIQSRAWFLGARKRARLVLDHPCYLFRTTA